MAAALGGSCTPAAADDPVLAAIQAAQIDKRSAIAYLRAGDFERARLALHRLETRWRRDTAAVPRIRRDAEPRLGEALRRFDADLSVTIALVVLGDGDGAIERLVALDDAFAPWRTARRQPLLADCVAEFARVWERIDGERSQMASLTPEAAMDLSAAALAAQVMIDRCDGEAQRHIRLNPYFRDLIDRMRTSFVRLQRALAERDAETARRVLAELRAIERLIGFRFG
jgi:hypothetical protein